MGHFFSSPIDPEIDRHDAVSILLLLIGAFFVFFGLASHVIRGRFFVPSAVLATLFGILLGPKGFKLLASTATGSDGWVSGDEGDEARSFLLWTSRLVLAIQVLSAALTLPSRYVALRKNQITLLVLLLPVMTLAWLVSAGFAYLIIPDVHWAEALIIGACVGPTDPVLAGAVIKGHFAERHVDEKLRNVLLSESGMNDGLGTPFLYLSLSLLFAYSNIKMPDEFPSTGGQILAHMLVSVVLYNFVLAMLVGLFVGWSLRKLLKISKDKGFIDENSLLVFSLAIAMMLVGITSILDMNQLVACFVAGTVLNWRHDMGAVLQTNFVEGLDNVLDIVIFTALGSVLPFDVWFAKDAPLSFGRLALFSLLVLLFRRLPAVLAFSRVLPSVEKFGEKIFLGWMGPIGVGALYYALEASEKIPGSIDFEKQVFEIVSFLVFISVIVHGLSIPTFLALTLVFPGLAPYLLGDRREVAKDFGPTSTEQAYNERQPLLGERGQSDTSV